MPHVPVPDLTAALTFAPQNFMSSASIQSRGGGGKKTQQYDLNLMMKCNADQVNDRLSKIQQLEVENQQMEERLRAFRENMAREKEKRRFAHSNHSIMNDFF